MLSKIVIWILKSVKIKGEDKARITTALLENIDALPLRDVIKFEKDGTLLIKGKKLELEQAQTLKAAVIALKSNYARNLIQEQLLYKASEMGLHQGLTPDMIMFSKAVVWAIQNEQIILNSLEE